MCSISPSIWPIVLPMRPTKRKSYPAAFKLQVVKYAEENNNRAADRKFNVSEKLVRDWRKQKDSLRSAKKTKKANRGKKPRWAELEDKLEHWILEQRAACRGVSTIQIRLKAQATAKELGIEEFQGGPSWCFRFMKRKNLSLRIRTSISQELPDGFVEKFEAFQDFVKEQIATHNITSDHIINMDEVPLTFDIPMTRTVESSGTRTVSIKTTGHEKTHFTVILSCTASGEKLPPMVVFKLKNQPREKLPAGVFIEVNEKGWMNTDLMMKWLSTCFSRRPDGFFKNKKALLVMDSMKAHICPEVKAVVSRQNCIPAIIPGGLTKLAQPLDIAVNHTFKNELRKLWEEWMSSGTHSFTNTGRMRRASYAQVCQWVKVAWLRVTAEVIQSGFRKARLWQYNNIPDPESDANSDPEPGLEKPNSCINELFETDTEDTDFEGFEDC